jgi:hypothetical protein
MSVIAARLGKSGTLYSNANAGVVFNEIAQSNIGISPTGVFAHVFDEVSGTSNGGAMQQLNTGTIKISGVFDEVTGIA